MNYQAKKNKRVHLETIEVGSSFHVPGTFVYGTVIKHGAMGCRVLMDGSVSYTEKGKVVLKQITTIIGNKTECIAHEDKHHGERLKAVARLGDQDTADSRETTSACV
tara:strand:- start:385 stop:705 length:321 start_codon:yes stop_codon:yes gene_type:complete